MKKNIYFVFYLLPVGWGRNKIYDFLLFVSDSPIQHSLPVLSIVLK